MQDFFRYISFVDIFNFCVFLIFTICYAYQLYYVLIGLIKKPKHPAAKKNHKFCAIISARNESATISNLLDSLNAQDYPKDKLDVFVIADNCTDDTAKIAHDHGAFVILRDNPELVGKGYALDYGMNLIMRQMMGVPADEMGRSVCGWAQRGTIQPPVGKSVPFPDNKLTDEQVANMPVPEITVTAHRNEEKKVFDISDYIVETEVDGIQTAGYEAFFVFDADNVLDKNYVAAMNRCYDAGYSVATSYRNTKNFDSNWISSGYATWFLREARFLSQSRLSCNTSCAVSGTGFYADTRIIRKNKGWKWFLLTEDIQFATQNIISANRIGYAPDAQLYDEQPITFKDSWNQRFRWTRGFYQVFVHYGGKLFTHIFTNPKGHKFACYDMLMTIAPGMLLSVITILFNLVIVILGICGVLSAGMVIAASLTSIIFCIVNYILFMFVLGAITIFVEWNKIRASHNKKVKAMFVFPLFMLTYIPLAIVALFKKVEWKPITHSFTVDVDEFKDSAEESK